MKKTILIIAITMQIGRLAALPTWDVLDKSMASWNVNEGAVNNKAWVLTKSGSGSTINPPAATQELGYVNIKKTNTWFSVNYGFLTPQALSLKTNTAYTIEVKARLKGINKEIFPDITPPTANGSEGGFESNQISARLNSRNLSIHLKYSVDNTGYITINPTLYPEDEEANYRINTSDWHLYRFVLHADNLSFDLYIDNLPDPIFENVPTSSMSGTNIIRLGAESNHRCNMDIEYVKMGTGDFCSSPKISSVVVGSDSHITNNERTIAVTINTTLIEDNTTLLLSLANEQGDDIVNPIEVKVINNKAVSNFTIPKTVLAGEYRVKAFAPDEKIGSMEILTKFTPYLVTDVSPLDAKMLPQVKPVGFIIEMDDYIFKAPSNEFIFPAIIDAKQFSTNGKFSNGQDILARYYRYYTPHENPGGMFLTTAPTLDGPWTERSTVINLNWAKAVPSNIINTADHISACQVVWNEVYNKFFMYFHGPNTTSHYATSDNLVDWSYGGIMFNCKQFSSKAQEASYAKVFEHEIPGLGNKYISLLMTMEGNIRKIHWAHSTDGVSWTTVKKPLISPDINHKKIPGTDIKPNYSGSFGNNIAGPFLLKKEGRCFVIVNGSSGHLFVIEVGEKFDMEVHWGTYMCADDVVIDTDNSGNSVAVPRIAAPVFIQNDEGLWYMFFEAGGRLGANIALAKEDTPSLSQNVENHLSDISIYPSSIKSGEQVTIRLTEHNKATMNIFDASGKTLSNIKLKNSISRIKIPYSPGLYLLKIESNEKITKTLKVVVSK